MASDRNEPCPRRAIPRQRRELREHHGGTGHGEQHVPRALVRGRRGGSERGERPRDAPEEPRRPALAAGAPGERHRRGESGDRRRQRRGPRQLQQLLGVVAPARFPAAQRAHRAADGAERRVADRDPRDGDENDGAEDGAPALHGHAPVRGLDGEERRQEQRDDHDVLLREDARRERERAERGGRRAARLEVPGEEVQRPEDGGRGEEVGAAGDPVDGAGQRRVHGEQGRRDRGHRRRVSRSAALARADEPVHAPERQHEPREVREAVAERARAPKAEVEPIARGEERPQLAPGLVPDALRPVREEEAAEDPGRQRLVEPDEGEVVAEEVAAERRQVERDGGGEDERQPGRPAAAPLAARPGHARTPPPAAPGRTPRRSRGRSPAWCRGSRA